LCFCSGDTHGKKRLKSGSADVTSVHKTHQKKKGKTKAQKTKLVKASTNAFGNYSASLLLS